MRLRLPKRPFWFQRTGLTGLAGIAFLLLGDVVPAAAGLVTPTERRRLAPLLRNAPMEIYVARGGPDACGPGCSEWIAVQGKFDQGAGKRFREFLNSTRRRNLTVYFHSPGGVLADGIEIGNVLRESGMTASIGRTVPEGCTVDRLTRGTCDKRIKSGSDVPSRLFFDGGQCHSACVFALAGAPTRRIPSGALIGIHTPRTDEQMWKRHVEKFPNAQRLTKEERHWGLWRLVLGFGLDPALIDLTYRVPHKSLYILSPEEISRYHLQSADRFETRWYAQSETKGRFHVLKAVSSAAGSMPTAVVQVSCVGMHLYQIAVFSAIDPRRAAQPSIARLQAPGVDVPFFSGFSGGQGAYWYWPLTTEKLRELAQTLGHVREAAFTVSYVDPGHSTGTVSFSTAGLSSALDELHSNCSQRKVT